MPIWTKVAGTWKKVLDPEIKKAGAWTPVKVVSVKVGGVWQQVFAIEIVAFVAANATNVSLQSLFASGDWSNPLLKKRVVVNPGVIVGSTNPAVSALRTGTGWAGALQLDNYGEIQGAGGVPNSGAGGHAILCEAAGLTIKNFGAIRGGGGAGGKGGNGGAGVYYTTVTEGPQYNYPSGSPRYWWQTSPGSSDSVWWGGSNYVFGDINSPYTVGGITWTRGTQRDGSTSGGFTTNYFEVYRSYQQSHATSGGTGGNGGRGKGYGQTNAAGSSGSAGGTNAGTGGTGGTGGDWASGGATGATGNSGNNGGGSGGTAGGAAGKAISGSNTLINTGVVNGATS
ncbi:hypothetical protein P10VF_048 [Rhizobium phage vB_RleM_P10VF]|uniref:Uncharacterized protein n=1 Tax=Rhizobium phage vB_RleM_P10VF TaxID=1527770 RepID=A0A076YQ17_9CAUD|nr:hypothetical protein P10VF_048 [Rhizobium phage vB_RleM_P10VF]AIK68261.1 hypothetical protein P10VF_048 [Rhizobium phage vB_RleM_P10VF]